MVESFPDKSGLFSDIVYDLRAPDSSAKENPLQTICT